MMRIDERLKSRPPGGEICARADRRRIAPISVVLVGALVSLVLVLSSFGAHSADAATTGTVRAWGDNQYGQLGNGTNTNSNTPVKVKNLAGVKALAGGQGHSLALKK